MFLLDTDTLSLHMRGHAKVVARFERESEQELVATSIISRIEVLQGRFDFVMKAADKDELLRAHALLLRWEATLTGYSILPLDEMAGREFERLRTIKSLRKIGRGDILIACVALAKRATLVTRNVKHFKLIPGLKYENWAD